MQYVAEYVKENLFKWTIEKLQNLHSKPLSTNDKKEPNNINTKIEEKSKLLNNNNDIKSFSQMRKTSFDNINNKSDKSDREVILQFLEELGDFEKSEKSNEANSESKSTNSCNLQVPSENGRKSSPSPRRSSGDRPTKPSPSPRRQGSEVENIVENNLEGECNGVSMKKEDPYACKKPNNSKKNSISSASKENGKDKKKEESGDSLYFDSHKNINYTRLLTDQILAVDNKVVEHCMSCTDMSGK